jgi:hypothetical protein
MPEAILHSVVGVARCDIESVGQFVVVDRGASVVDAGGHELVRAGVFADDCGLPADELGDLPGLELPPGDVVLGLEVAVGRPQVRPRRQPMRPVDQAPLAVEGIHVAVLLAQMVDEALEDAAVVQEFRAGFVVDLEAEYGRVSGVPGGDLPDHPFGVEPEGGVGEVDLLAGAPADAFTRTSFARDLRVEAGEPRRYGVRRGAEDDADTTGVGTVEHRLGCVSKVLVTATR